MTFSPSAQMFLKAFLLFSLTFRVSLTSSISDIAFTRSNSTAWSWTDIERLMKELNIKWQFPPVLLVCSMRHSLLASNYVSLSRFTLKNSCKATNNRTEHFTASCLSTHQVSHNCVRVCILVSKPSSNIHCFRMFLLLADLFITLQILLIAQCASRITSCKLLKERDISSEMQWT